MTRMSMLVPLLLAGIALVPGPAVAEGSDLEKEKRWRDQIVETLIEGDAVDLNAAGQPVLGLYTEAATPDGDASPNAAVLVHGIGVHPDWPQVIHPLRAGLPERGWSILSVQMPVLPNAATAADYVPLLDAVAPRLDAAIAYLRTRGAERIALVAHSLGATMAADYLADRSDTVDAFVAIGLSGGAPQERLDGIRALARLRLPTLDLYGQNDLEAVLATAPARARSALEGGNAGYNQAQVPEGDHFFEGQEDALVEAVSLWLQQTVEPIRSTPQGEQTPPNR